MRLTAHQAELGLELEWVVEEDGGAWIGLHTDALPVNERDGHSDSTEWMYTNMLRLRSALNSRMDQK